MSALSSTAVGLPLVATSSIAGLSVPASSMDSNPAAALARAVEVVDLLRARYICDGWGVDEPAAVRALAFCQKYAQDGTDPDDEREAAFDFFSSHGISLDWIFRGDVSSLICGLASHSKQASRQAA